MASRVDVAGLALAVGRRRLPPPVHRRCLELLQAVVFPDMRLEDVERECTDAVQHNPEAVANLEMLSAGWRVGSSVKVL